MAGSYLHCCSQEVIVKTVGFETDEHYLGPFDFSLIENMDDAHEACDMMHHMIQTLASLYAEVVPEATTPAKVIRHAANTYYESAENI